MTKKPLMQHIILNAVSFLCDLEPWLKWENLAQEPIWPRFAISKEVIEWSINEVWHLFKIRCIHCQNIKQSSYEMKCACLWALKSPLNVTLWLTVSTLTYFLSQCLGWVGCVEWNTLTLFIFLVKFFLFR